MNVQALPREDTAVPAGQGWRTPLAWGLLLAWLGVTAWVFWWLEFGGLRCFAPDERARERLALFQTERLDPLAVEHVGQEGEGEVASAVVVHFRDPACACNAEADAHFLSLVSRHQGRGVTFVIADPPGEAPSPARGLERLPRLPAAEVARLWGGLPALPAAAVFDTAGRPVYVGPYANAARCSTSRGGPVEAALATAERGTGPLAGGELALGCFCERRPTALAAGAGPQPHRY